MTYRVRFTEAAGKALKKLDKSTAVLIMAWIKKNLEGCSNPRQHGKGLTANPRRQWFYRVGDYRLLAEIQEDEIIILILNIGHRRDIYGS